MPYSISIIDNLPRAQHLQRSTRISEWKAPLLCLVLVAVVKENASPFLLASGPYTHKKKEANRVTNIRQKYGQCDTKETGTCQVNFKLRLTISIPLLPGAPGRAHTYSSPFWADHTQVAGQPDIAGGALSQASSEAEYFPHKQMDMNTIAAGGLTAHPWLTPLKVRKNHHSENYP